MSATKHQQRVYQVCSLITFQPTAVRSIADALLVIFALNEVLVIAIKHTCCHVKLKFQPTAVGNIAAALFGIFALVEVLVIAV